MGGILERRTSPKSGSRASKNREISSISVRVVCAFRRLWVTAMQHAANAATSVIGFKLSMLHEVVTSAALARRLRQTHPAMSSNPSSRGVAIIHSATSNPPPVVQTGLGVETIPTTSFLIQLQRLDLDIRRRFWSDDSFRDFIKDVLDLRDSQLSDLSYYLEMAEQREAILEYDLSRLFPSQRSVKGYLGNGHERTGWVHVWEPDENGEVGEYGRRLEKGADKDKDSGKRKT